MDQFDYVFATGNRPTYAEMQYCYQALLHEQYLPIFNDTITFSNRLQVVEIHQGVPMILCILVGLDAAWRFLQKEAADIAQYSEAFGNVVIAEHYQAFGDALTK